jgi:hypothetical protein
MNYLSFRVVFTPNLANFTSFVSEPAYWIWSPDRMRIYCGSGSKTLPYPYEKLVDPDFRGRNILMHSVPDPHYLAGSGS